MNTTCLEVTATSCCHVARSSSTACAPRSAPRASHSPMRSQMPWASSPFAPRPEAVASAPARSSTENKTRLPSAATRGTCDAMGTDSPPANSCGSRRREYCEGRPVSGNASTDPACQKTLASASDSPQRYDTAMPSRNSTAWMAPIGRPGSAPSNPPGPSAPPGPSGPAAGSGGRAASPERCAHGERGPMRSSVPCRSGGSTPSMGSDACSIPITTTARSPRRCPEHSPSAPGPTPGLGGSNYRGRRHAPDEPTGVWQSRWHAHALGGPRLSRPDPPGDRPRPAEAARRPGA